MKILEIVRDCPMCNKASSVVLKGEEVDGISKYWAYGNTLIQDALPNTEPAVREFVRNPMGSYCNGCMKMMFGKTSDRITSENNVGIFDDFGITEIENEEEIRKIYDTDFSIEENLENFKKKYL